MFSRNVGLIRRRRGLSQEALAKRAGMQRDSVQKIEAGKRSVRLGTLLALADALGVDPAELLAGLR
ncbi:MAG: helix-turn-helix transcriptional regulator [Actinobacteria bacterium]|nr:helix-turn-helix transcriptional regulator [Actinomycetota bacterium]